MATNTWATNRWENSRWSDNSNNTVDTNITPIFSYQPSPTGRVQGLNIKSIILDGDTSVNGSGLKEGVNAAWRAFIKVYEARKKTILEIERLYIGAEKNPPTLRAFASLKKRWTWIESYTRQNGIDIAALPQSILDAAFGAERDDLSAIIDIDKKNVKYKTLRSVIDNTDQNRGFIQQAELFIQKSQIYREEVIEFQRFDALFQTSEVKAIFAKIKQEYAVTMLPAELKALCAQESWDFTNTAIAGLENKDKGEKTYHVNSSFLGIGQIGTDGLTDGIKWAKDRGFTINNPPDPRLNVKTCIVLAAACLGSNTDYLKPAFATKNIAEQEKKKMIWAAYNSGYFTVQTQMNRLSKKDLQWADIESKMSGETQGYIRGISFRLGRV